MTKELARIAISINYCRLLAWWQR